MRKTDDNINIRQILGAFLCAAALLLAGAANVRAQSDTMAAGSPPLTSQMVERYTNLMEWSLDLRFTRAERSAIETQMVAYWRAGDEKNIKAVVQTLDFEKRLADAGEAKKREMQPQIKRAVLDALEKESSDSMNALMLEAYRKNQAAVAENTDGIGDLSALVGRWQVLHGNSIVGVDINTGRIGDGNSMIAEYDIRPDGRVSFTFVLQQSNYGCTTRIKTSKSGRAAVSGSRVTYSYDGGTTVSEDNCNQKYNYTKKLAAEQETFDFEIKPSGGGKQQFCFVNEKLKDCAVRVK